MTINWKPGLTLRKDPSDVTQLVVDWEDWLEGDTLATSTWTAESGLTVDSNSNTTTTATVKISGGTAGTTYTLTNTITTTTSAETRQRSIEIAVQDL